MQIEPIGWVSSPYKEKFGAPRQSGVVPEAIGYLHFHPEYRVTDAFREIENYSHIWIIFHFHQAEKDGWKATVRPPELGGNMRVGVFATRSPFRPNNMGMTVLELLAVEDHSEHGISLKVAGLDVVDRTPVLDVKPYVPYADAQPEAKVGFSAPPEKLEVVWGMSIPEELSAEEVACIEASIAADPRPAYQRDEQGRGYGMRIGVWNVIWTVNMGIACIGSMSDEVQ